ncbi:DUF4351 domain-containing protein [Gammaproteobacteria bacterium]
MKTDQPIYLFMAMGAEAFRVLTGGLLLPGPYRFNSMTFKTLERRIDGVFEPEGHEGPVYLVEFQGQFSEAAWYNLMVKVGLYGEAYPGRDVRGILVFLHSNLDPRHPKGIGKRKDRLFQAVYLDRFLPKWLEQEPNNPYVVVFAPLVLKAKSVLREQAPRLWETIQKAPLEPNTREILSEILAFWFFERFNTLSKQEVWAMFHSLTPLKETRAYREILAEGRAEGRAEGLAEGLVKGLVKGRTKGMAKGLAKGKTESLKRLLTRRFGALPDWALQRIDGASLDQIDIWLDGLLDAESAASLLDGERH